MFAILQLALMASLICLTGDLLAILVAGRENATSIFTLGILMHSRLDTVFQCFFSRLIFGTRTMYVLLGTQKDSYYNAIFVLEPCWKWNMYS